MQKVVGTKFFLELEGKGKIERKRKKPPPKPTDVSCCVCVLEAQWWLFFQIVKVRNEGGCSCLIGFFFCILYGKPVYLPHNHFYTLDSTSPSKWAGKRLTGSLFSRKYSYHLFLKKKTLVAMKFLCGLILYSFSDYGCSSLKTLL